MTDAERAALLAQRDRYEAALRLIVEAPGRVGDLQAERLATVRRIAREALAAAQEGE